MLAKPTSSINRSAIQGTEPTDQKARALWMLVEAYRMRLSILLTTIGCTETTHCCRTGCGARRSRLTTCCWFRVRLDGNLVAATARMPRYDTAQEHDDAISVRLAWQCKLLHSWQALFVIVAIVHLSPKCLQRPRA
jgi:hypothetical protein